MSMKHLLATVRGLLEDPADGLAPTVAQVAAAEGLANVRTDLRFVKWTLAGSMHPSGAPNVAVTVRRWRGEQNLDNTHRDAAALLEIRVEWFDHDPAVIEDNIAAACAALPRVLDKLRPYSDGHGGTIIDVEGSYDFTIGTFAGSAGAVTTNGFIASCTVSERKSGALA